MHVFRFHEFGLKTLIHDPKIGFFGDFTPKWGAMSTKLKKGTSLRESASFEPSYTKIIDASFPNKGTNK